MGNNIATGSKKPKKLDRQTQSAQLPPLPKMYQMGIDKGRQLERERIIELLTTTQAGTVSMSDCLERNDSTSLIGLLNDGQK
jgi:hypothetical protein